MKKSISILCLILVSSFYVRAQNTVKASDILEKIKRGENVSYSSTTIEGVLDLTFSEEKIKKGVKKSNSWWGSKKGNTIEEDIKGSVTFSNCVFTDDVLAYLPEGNAGNTFIANFKKSAVFKDCVFEQKAMFKYSNFYEKADFKGSVFEHESSFKYAKFNDFAAFSDTNFKDSATFKYAKFNDGVSFRNALFGEDLDIKYTKVSGTFDITGMKVTFDINSKYTKINGESFTKTLVNKN